MDERTFLESLRLDRKSGVPLYVQLAAQIKAAIGPKLQPGVRLPTIRAVAVQLTIDQNTVLRVFQDLEAEGVVESLRGRGTFIRKAPEPLNDALQAQRILELAREMVTTARIAGLDPEKVGHAIVAFSKEK